MQSLNKEAHKTWTYQDRVANLDRHIANGTLVRRDWGDGYSLACLLTALAPECVNYVDRWRSCPADVMPLWMAFVVPIIDDKGSDFCWSDTVVRFAKLAHRWHVLTPQAWETVKWRWFDQSILGRIELYAASARSSIERVRDVCRLFADGKSVEPEFLAMMHHGLVVTKTEAYYHALFSARSILKICRGALESPSEAMYFSSWVRVGLYCTQAGSYDLMTGDLFDLLEAEIVKQEGAKK